MRKLEEIVSIVERAIDSKQKRHLFGGILVSVSIMLSGLAITILTIKTEENDEY